MRGQSKSRDRHNARLRQLELMGLATDFSAACWSAPVDADTFEAQLLDEDEHMGWLGRRAFIFARRRLGARLLSRYGFPEAFALFLGAKQIMRVCSLGCGSATLRGTQPQTMSCHVWVCPRTW